MSSALEEQLWFQLKACGLPLPEREFRFHPVRKWRFDMAWPERLLAVELEGGVYGRGRHTRPQGFTGDCEKYNTAVVAGWRLLRFTGSMVRDGSALETIEKVLQVCA